MNGQYIIRLYGLICDGKTEGVSWRGSGIAGPTDLSVHAQRPGPADDRNRVIPSGFALASARQKLHTRCRSPLTSPSPNANVVATHAVTCSFVIGGSARYLWSHDGNVEARPLAGCCRLCCAPAQCQLHSETEPAGTGQRHVGHCNPAGSSSPVHRRVAEAADLRRHGCGPCRAAV